MAKTTVLHIDNKQHQFDPNVAWVTQGDGVVIHADTSIPGLAPTWEIYVFFQGGHRSSVATGECGCR